ncbi:hypothetical protein NDU88_003279 [Pleurodeles waltl]|uniref:Uncharacterized protein n=1 Tax=Pleurodeles waltl TaxID=8319 RepID=A0AAV7P9F9_PLEWA|nr:hypothetical protein NDU88_003279 [Pleurodeles waltl]
MSSPLRPRRISGPEQRSLIVPLRRRGDSKGLTYISFGRAPRTLRVNACAERTLAREKFEIEAEAPPGHSAEKQILQ